MMTRREKCENAAETTCSSSRALLLLVWEWALHSKTIRLSCGLTVACLFPKKVRPRDKPLLALRNSHCPLVSMHAHTGLRKKQAS